MNTNSAGSITGTYEETYLSHTIYIEPSRDPYREGFEWAVCKDQVEIEAGLAFSIASAIKEARTATDKAAKSIASQ